MCSHGYTATEQITKSYTIHDTLSRTNYLAARTEEHVTDISDINTFRTDLIWVRGAPEVQLQPDSNTTTTIRFSKYTLDAG
jgi:hypothetical protein